MIDKSPSDFQTLITKAVDRRTFMHNGASFGLTAFALGNPFLLQGCSAEEPPATSKNIIPTNSDDTITLSEEYTWYPVISWGDPLFSNVEPFDENNRAADAKLRFGDNNDGMDIFDVDGKTVLAVNNEFSNVPVMFPDGPKAVSYTHLTLPTIYSV